MSDAQSRGTEFRIRAWPGRIGWWSEVGYYQSRINIEDRVASYWWPTERLARWAAQRWVKKALVRRERYLAGDVRTVSLDGER